jgi:N,N'-diacetyllegionaminate synthase
VDPSDSRVVVIAEVGSTHDGSFGNAKAAVEAVGESGADAAKFQTHIPEAETIMDAPAPSYFADEPRFDYFQRTGFTKEQWIALKAFCEEKGLTFMSSAFSAEAVALLEEVGMEVWKIPSGEVTNLRYLDLIAQTGKPVILSSGMSTQSELDEAVNTVLKHHDRLTVLQCTSEYPCPPEHVGLNVMLELKERYGLPVGLSDHTTSNSAALAAVTLGASVIEKHFALSSRLYGSDARHSAEPDQFTDLVKGVREIEAMLAVNVDKNDVSQLANMKQIFEKSVVSLLDIPAGTLIDESMIGVKKPGTGIPAKKFTKVVGSRATHDIPADSVLSDGDVDFGGVA